MLYPSNFHQKSPQNGCFEIFFKKTDNPVWDCPLLFYILQCIYIRDEIVDAVCIFNLGRCALKNQEFAQAVFLAVVRPVICIS